MAVVALLPDLTVGQCGSGLCVSVCLCVSERPGAPDQRNKQPYLVIKECALQTFHSRRTFLDNNYYLIISFVEL